MLDISFHLIHPRHDRRLGGIGRVVPIAASGEKRIVHLKKSASTDVSLAIVVV